MCISKLAAFSVVLQMTNVYWTFISTFRIHVDITDAVIQIQIEEIISFLNSST